MVVLAMLLFWYRTSRKVRTHAQHMKHIGWVHIILHGIRWMHQVSMVMTIEVVRNVRMAVSRWDGGVRRKERRGIGGVMGRDHSILGVLQRLLKLVIPESRRRKKVISLQIQRRSR